MENLVIDSPVCAVEAPFSQNTINSVIPNQPVSMLVATSTRLKIEQIAIEVSAWESGAYTESNMILYALIQKSYAMYLELTDTKDGNLKHRKQGLNDYLMLAGLGAYIDKPLTTKLIRALFGNRDRRRLSTYNTVLKFLIKNEFAVSDVPAKVAELGGVQEISLGRAEGYLTAKERAAKVREEVADAIAVVFHTEMLTYRELRERAEAVAGQLRALGVGRVRICQRGFTRWA
jgi:hypothetical protein